MEPEPRGWRRSALRPGEAAEPVGGARWCLQGCVRSPRHRVLSQLTLTTARPGPGASGSRSVEKEPRRDSPRVAAAKRAAVPSDSGRPGSSPAPPWGTRASVHLAAGLRASGRPLEDAATAPRASVGPAPTAGPLRPVSRLHPPRLPRGAEPISRPRPWSSRSRVPSPRPVCPLSPGPSRAPGGAAAGRGAEAGARVPPPSPQPPSPSDRGPRAL